MSNLVDFDKKTTRMFRWGLFVYAMYVVGVLTVWAGIAYAIVHFIHKFW